MHIDHLKKGQNASFHLTSITRAKLYPMGSNDNPKFLEYFLLRLEPFVIFSKNAKFLLKKALHG